MCEELAKGGGTLFGKISRADKAYLNVNLNKNKDSPEPSVFLNAKSREWHGHWAPANPKHTHEQVCEALSGLRVKALEEPAKEFNLDDWELNGRYKNTTLGIDNWKMIAMAGVSAAVAVLKGWAASKFGDRSPSMMS